MRSARLVVLGLFFSYASAVTAQTRLQTGIDPDAKLPYWQISNAGMSLRLVQRLPDQTRGYFEARGFSDSQANIVARSCVFQTVFRNTSNLHQPSPLTYNLHDWIIHVGGKIRHMKMREDWEREWRRLKVAQAARLAFNWSLYPTHQLYQPGDYNWGMSVFNLKPGTQFDLTVVWHQYGKTHTRMIRHMRCAPDIHPQPGSRSKP